MTPEGPTTSMPSRPRPETAHERNPGSKDWRAIRHKESHQEGTQACAERRQEGLGEAHSPIGLLSARCFLSLDTRAMDGAHDAMIGPTPDAMPYGTGQPGSRRSPHACLLIGSSRHLGVQDFRRQVQDFRLPSHITPQGDLIIVSDLLIGYLTRVTEKKICEVAIRCDKPKWGRRHTLR